MDELSGGKLRLALASLLALLLIAGCESTKDMFAPDKNKNPVVPPPPRRIPEGETGTARRAGTASLSDREPVQADRAAPADRWKPKSNGRPDANPPQRGNQQIAVQEPGANQGTLTSWESTSDADRQSVRQGDVAATVNGVPIFVDDMLFQYRGSLDQARRQMPPEVFREQRRKLVQKMLPRQIEQELLLQALRLKIPKEEQFTQLKKSIDKQYNEELAGTMKELGVSTIGELEVKLRKDGSSVDTLRTNFRNLRLAQQYLSMKALPQSGFDRPDLLAYYREHIDDYAIPARAKWQQIQISYSKAGGKTKARRLAGQVIARLESGEDFAEIAREVSDGPTASTGGSWDWTTCGSMKLAEVDRALFELPVGEAGQVIEGPDAIEIVCVLERENAHHTPFEEVQVKIKESLRKAEFERTASELLSELKAHATIVDYTDRL